MAASPIESHYIGLINSAFPSLSVEAPEEDYAAKGPAEIAREFNEAMGAALEGVSVRSTANIRAAQEENDHLLALQVNGNPDVGLGGRSSSRAVRHLEIVRPLVNIVNEDDLKQSVALWSNTPYSRTGEDETPRASVGVSWKYDYARAIQTPPLAQLLGVGSEVPSYKVEQEVGAERDPAKVKRAFGLVIQVVRQLSAAGLDVVEFQPRYHDFGRGGVDSIPID
jgi:hypothetical protein